GGSRGVGAAACRLLAANGARVAAVGRDAAALRDVVDELRWMGSDAIGVVADCADPRAVEALRGCVLEELGPPGVVLALAGSSARPLALREFDLDGWRRAVDSDLTATFLTVQAFLPSMLAVGAGAIVTMGAAAGPPTQTNVAFVAAKAAIAAFTRQLAAEV